MSYNDFLNEINSIGKEDYTVDSSFLEEVNSFSSSKNSVPQQQDFVPYANEERGFLGDLFSSSVRGAANVVDLAASGLEQIGLENDVDSWIKEKKKTSDILKPDISSAFGYNSSAYEGITSIPESVVTSVGSGAAGAVTGAAIGGGVPGAVIGGLGSMLLTFGLGTYKNAKEEYLAKNPGDEEGASEYAGIQAASEVGFELASDAFAAATFGGSKIITAIAKQGLKPTVRNLLSMSGKELIKNIGKVGATETLSELATYGVQANADQAYGMGDGVTYDGLVQTGVASLGMSLLFAGVGSKYTYDQKKRLYNGLKSSDQVVQQNTANLITLELQKAGDNDLATMWETYTKSFIDNGVPIHINDNFVELGNKINNVDIEISDIASENPDIQKNATDKILQEAGIDSDGTLLTSKDDTLGISMQTRESLDYNRDRIRGTKEAIRNRELLEGRQEVEKRQAEREQQITNPVQDPVQVLQDSYTQSELNKANQEYTQYEPNLPYDRQLREEQLANDQNSLLRYEADIQRPEEVTTVSFEEVAQKYTKDKNYKRTLESFLTPNDRKNLEILKKRLELEPDSNNVKQELLQDVKVVEEKVVQKAEEVVAKGIKGSKRVEQAKKVIKEIKPELIQTEVYTTASTEETGGDTKGVELATTETPETIYQNKKITEEFKAENPTIPISQELDDAETALRSVAQNATTPLSSAIMNSNTKTAIAELRKVSRDKRQAVLLSAIKEIGKDTAMKYPEYISNMMREIMQGVSNKRIEGTRATDKIIWKDINKANNIQEGNSTSKQTPVTIVRVIDETTDRATNSWDIFVKNKKRGTASGKVAARQMAEKLLQEDETLGLSPEATAVMENNSWNVQRALSSLSPNDTSIVQEITEKYGVDNIQKFKDIPSLIEYIISKGTSREQVLASVIKSVTPKDKLNDIKLVVDTTRASASHFNGTIYLNSDSTKAALHELVHALSVRELLSLEEGSDLYKDLNKIINATRKYILKNNILEKSQLILLDSLSSSKDFKDNIDNFNFTTRDQYVIAYALLNPKEFLAQAFSEKVFQDVLDKVEISTGSRIIKAIDSFIKFIGKLLNLPTLHNNALGSVIRLSAELFKSPIDYQAFTVEESPEANNRAFISNQFEKLKKQKENISYSDVAKEIYSKFETQFSKTFQDSFEALKEISEPLAHKLKRMDSDKNQKVTTRTEVATPFIHDLRKLSAEKAKQIFFLIDNYGANNEIRAELKDQLKRLSSDKRTQDIAKNFDNVVNMLEEMYSEAKLAGLTKYKDIPFYFPKVVKDYVGLVAYLRNKDFYSKSKKFIDNKNISELIQFLKKEELLEEVKPYLEDKNFDGLLTYLKDRSDWGVIDEALKAAEIKARDSGKVLTDVDRAEVVSNLINTGRSPIAQIRTPSGLKKRTINTINADMMKFYYTPIEALGIHINDMTERIEINHMLGITSNKKIQSALKTLNDQLDKETDLSKIQELEAKIKEEEDKLPEINQLIEEGIGKLFLEQVKDKKVTEYEQARAKDLIRARITQRGTNKAVSMIRSAGLLGSLTQLSTGLRNLTDGVWGTWMYGGLNMLKSAIAVAKNTSYAGGGKFDIKGDFINKNFLDFQAPLREYSSVSNFVDKAISLSGLKLVDTFMKITTMEAAYKHYQKLEQSQFIKKWSNVFGDKVEQVYKDIQDGKLTDDVKYLLASDISDFQPIFLINTPEYYLKGGNGRILYLLKMYSIKSSNNFYRETIKKIRTGVETNDKAEVYRGFKNLATLGTLFVLAGASTDWLIDWLNGKSPDLSDSMVDTILTLAMVSKYSLDKSRKTGLAKTYMTNLIPPTGLFDLPYQDLVGLFNGEFSFASAKLIPMVGTLTYNQFTETGEKNSISAARDRIFEEFKDSNTINQKDLSWINNKIREYNSNYHPKKLESYITISSLRKSLKRQ